MAETTSKTTKRPPKRWAGFLDKFRREIVPEHFRGKLTGDVFLGFDPADIPPQGSTVELRVKAKVGGAHLKPTDDADKVYVAYVDLKASEAHDFVIVVPEPEPTRQTTVEDLLPEGADSVTISHPASGTSATIKRPEGPANGNGTRRSAEKARAGARKRTTTRAR